MFVITRNNSGIRENYKYKYIMLLRINHDLFINVENIVKNIY